MKGLAKDHICITHGHKGKESRMGGEGQSGGGGNGDICNSINKNEVKKLF